MLVIEEILDRVAARARPRPGRGARAEPLSRRAARRTRRTTARSSSDDRIPRIWRELLASSRARARGARQIDAFNATLELRSSAGIAITPVKFGISFTATFLNQAGALVLVYRDGTVQVNHGGTEMGQGLYTKMLGVAMRELGVPAERVRVMTTATDKVPNTSATAASSGSDLNGAAVQRACETLRERLAPVAARAARREPATAAPSVRSSPDGQVVRAPQAPSVALPFEQVTRGARTWRRCRCRRPASTARRASRYDRAEGRGKPFHYFAYGAAVTRGRGRRLTGDEARARASTSSTTSASSLEPGDRSRADRGRLRPGHGLAHGRGAARGTRRGGCSRTRPTRTDPGDRRRARATSASRCWRRARSTTSSTAARRWASRRSCSRSGR